MKISDFKILISCESSGRTRDAFRRRGFNAISCDLEPSERPGPHIQADAREVMQDRWDLVIAHPPCTFLCAAGVQYMHSRPEQWIPGLEEGADFFLACLNANSPRIAVENPIPHRFAVEKIGRKYDIKVHPWQFGSTDKKDLCFWLKGLPGLKPTKIVTPNTRMRDLPPSKDRSKIRSRTDLEVANVMAMQWGTWVFQSVITQY